MSHNAFPYIKVSTLCLFAILATQSTAQEIVDQWRYTVRRPSDGWQQTDYDDSNWQKAFGGFGTWDTPGARVGTTWATNQIWLRKTFKVESVPKKLAIMIHHDEDATIFLNGKPLAKFDGYTTDYKVVSVADDKRELLKPGDNLLAVQCNQTAGGQFIDVHLVDADNVPKLPRPTRSSKPFVSELTTTWGENVTAENVWTEYPRPQLKRNNWTNLNGNWDYCVTPIDQTSTPTEWSGKILVPFSLESKLSGVQRLLDESEALWYRRSFQVGNAKQRLRLNFEAVDYRCEVFVNGNRVGTHIGGNTPFAFDITDAVKNGTNELIVRVEDATEAWQLRGKQVINARGIWYTQVSGIWQTVWLETVPQGAITDVVLQPNVSRRSVRVKLELEDEAQHDRVDVIVTSGDQQVLTQSWSSRGDDEPYVQGGQFVIPQPQLKLWSPSTPHLYDLKITTYRGNQIVDSVQSYFGMREVGKVKDENGHWRFTLNGETIFHWGPLDQGWWPDGLLTPPSDEAMLFDIEWLKKAGFNMIRKHIKVEPRRYYYHCDRLGMMVWQDQVSGGVAKAGAWPEWTRLAPNPKDAIWPTEQHAQFMAELDAMIDELENHPSIVCWVPFNEAWGQHQTVEVGEWTSQRDPSRLINIASGGNFWPAGDIVDEHRYPHPGFPFELNQGGRFDDFIKVIGEFGGHGFPVQGHQWDVNRRNWGYGDLPKTMEEFRGRYRTSLKMLNELRKQGIAAGVYTQTTDVEGEINGLMTYDRKVVKIPAEELRAMHQVLFSPQD